MFKLKYLTNFGSRCKRWYNRVGRAARKRWSMNPCAVIWNRIETFWPKPLSGKMSSGDCMATTNLALVVADAGPLIHLDELAALDVLSHYKAVFVPNAVWLEVERHRPQALQQTSVKLIRQLPSAPSASISAMTAIYTLHHGEQEALSLCLNHAADVLLTDDTAARLAAKSLNITVHGTLGLLIHAARLQLRTPSEVLALLAAIPQQTTLHIRPSLLNEIVTRVKAEWESEL